MENDLGFDSVPQEPGFFLEEQNALDTSQPGLEYELLQEGLLSLFYAQQTANYNWSQPPHEVNIYGNGSTPLDHRGCTSRPVTKEEILDHNQEWSDGCLDWALTPRAWSTGVTFSPKTSRQRLACHYPGCRSTPFRTTCDLKVHLKDHLYEILSHWMDDHSQPCKWPGCLSKATFKSKKALQTHLENIHVNPLLCPEKGCPYRNPFRNNYDLKRHVKTIHSGEKELRFQCPFPACGEFPKTFVRKDKWLDHLRSGHDDLACPLSHCDTGMAGLQFKLVEHIKNFHGNFECGLGSCAQQPLSRFAKFELLKHLEFHHGLENGGIDIAQNAANQANDRTVRAKDLPRETIWRDCRVCLGDNGIQERETDGDELICLDD